MFSPSGLLPRAPGEMNPGTAAPVTANPHYQLIGGEAAIRRLVVHPPLPRGVYLWGAVGRGKTFLLDSFYRCLPLVRRRRVHFHHFMRDAHRELDALKGQVRARVTLLACDDHIAENAPWEFEPWDTMQLPAGIAGGGGTDFRPVFDWVEHENRSPNMLVYFTDAEGDFPKTPPNYPVIWLVKGKGAVPWGERVQLN